MKNYKKLFAEKESRMGKTAYREWLVDTLADFKIDGAHYDYRTNELIEQKLIELKIY